MPRASGERPPADPGRPGGYTLPQETHWPTIVAVLVAGVAAACQVGKVAAALPQLRGELDLDLVTAGWLVSLLGVVGASLGMVIGGVADRFGPRRVMLTGLGLLALGSTGGAFSGGPNSLLAWRLVEGVGFIAVVVVAPVMMFRVAGPRHNRLIFGVWGTYMAMGLALILFGAVPILAAWGWRGLWLTNGVLAAGLVPLVALASRPRAEALRPAPASGSPLAGFGVVLSRPGPVLLAVCFASYTINFFALMGFLPTFLVDSLGYEPVRALPLVALIALGNAAGALLTSWLLQRGMAAWVLIVLGSGLMGCCLLGVFSPLVSEATRLTLAVGAVLVGALVPISVLACAPLHAPTPALIGSTNGLFMQGSNIGQLAGPPLVGFAVASAGSWQAAPVVMLTVSGCGVLAAVVSRFCGR